MGEFNSLKEIFLQLGKDRDWKLLGSEDHCKYEPGYCRVDYDEWDMYEGRRDSVINYWNGFVNFFIRDAGADGTNQFNYTIRTAYLEEKMDFLKAIDSGLARELVDSEPLCADKKNTEVMYSMSWADYGDVYAFLKQHIQKDYDEF